MMSDENINFCLVKVEYSVGDELELYLDDIEFSHIDVYLNEVSRTEVYSVFREGLEIVSLGPSVSMWQYKVSAFFRFQKSGLYSIKVTAIDGSVSTTPCAVNTSSHLYSGVNVIVLNHSTWRAYNCSDGLSRYRNFRRYKNGLPEETKYLKLIRMLSKAFLLSCRYARKIFGLNSAVIWPTGVSVGPNWTKGPFNLQKPIYNEHLDAPNPYTQYCDHLAGHEWRGVAWLMKNYSCIEFCSDTNLEKLAGEHKPKNIIFLGHPEYFTSNALKKVVELHNSGANLIFLSGNSFYNSGVSIQGNQMYISKSTSFETDYDIRSQLPFYTDLSITDNSDIRLIDVENRNFPKIFKNGDCLGSESYLSFTKPRLDPIKYDEHAPGVLRSLVSYDFGCSGWEVDKVFASFKDHIVAKGNNMGGGADVFYLPASQTKGHFLSVGSISYIGSLLRDKKLSAFTKALLEPFDL